DRASFTALEPLVGLLTFDPGARGVGFLGAAAEWVGNADAGRPRRVVAGKELVEHIAEARDRAGPDDETRETGRRVTQHLCAAQAVGRIVQVEADIRQLLVVRVFLGDLRVVDVLSRTREVGALTERPGDRGVEVSGDRGDGRGIGGLDRDVPAAAIGRGEKQHAPPRFRPFYPRPRPPPLFFLRGALPPCPYPLPAP